MATKKPEYDIVIVGAGIQGAGVAQAAAAANCRTLLLERNSGPAQETSSKSSKLIHGGLRYLESLQFGLVRECLREKQILLNIAPGLVKKARFIIPVYNHSKRSPVWIQAGLWLYRLLGYPGTAVRGKYTRKQWSEHPELCKDGLLALLEYEDAQTDDVKLTQAVTQSAKQQGATLRYNCKIQNILYDATRKHYIILTNNNQRITSRHLVNATGAWVNEFTKCITPTPQPQHISLVRGSHLIINRPALPCCYYLESREDHRAVFVLPWYGKTMIGTTEIEQSHPECSCEPSQFEIDYLLRCYNHYFPDTHATENDISAMFAGLRVLPQNGTSANAKARDTRLATDATLPGYVAIVGGKLTAYRSTAIKVLRILECAKNLPATHTIRL